MVKWSAPDRQLGVRFLLRPFFNPMTRDHFKFRKENQLKKSDKSLKQSWDKKITNLCNKINSLDNYYTTSSCSGRIVLIINSKEKRDDLFIKVWHNKITFKELKQTLDQINQDKLIYFKQDPVIIHIACKTLENAQDLINTAMKAGWKRNGIITSNKRFVVELNATGKLEFPIYKNKILVNDDFLELITKEANKKLEMSWECIEKLTNTLPR